MGFTKYMLVLVAFATTAATAAVQDWHVRYYAGTLNIRMGGAVYQEKVVMYQVNSPENSMVTQMACVKDAGKAAYLVPTYMMHQGNGQLAISNSVSGSGGSLSGQGAATGQEWYWDKYQLDMKYAPSNKPNDYVTMKANVHVVPGGMRVRKRVWYSNGKVKQDWSGALPEISKESFLKIASAMKCPAIP